MNQNMSSSAVARAASPADQRQSERRFFLAVAIGLAVVVFVGFSRTYYLKGLFGAKQLPLYLHIHGAVMTAWYALFIVQVRLVATRRVQLHRKLGIAGVFLAAIVAVLGTVVSLGLARRRLHAHPDSAAGPFLLGLQLVPIVLVFVILMCLAVAMRRRPDYHKRFMTLAMLTVIGPAVVRLPGIDDQNIPAAIVVNILLVLICAVADAIRNRRLHPAFGWGAALVIGSIFVMAPLAQTQWWIHLVRRLLI
jgi:hypothetical protein